MNRITVSVALILLLGVLSFGSTQVEAATGSIAFFTDSTCKSPATDISAQGGLPTDGTCILMSVNSYTNKYHRLTCGGASGPVYEQFSSSDCSGTAQYSFKGTAATTDTTCVAGTSTYQQNYAGAVMLQCTEVIYTDRIALNYYGDATCNSTKIIGPIYGPPLGACKDSSSYSDSRITSTTTYCSSDSSTILNYKFADNRCTVSAWSSIDGSTASGACNWENRGSGGSWYAKRTCPTSSVAGPAFPPTGNDVSLSYTCSDYYGCKSGCKVTKATRLGQCMDASSQFPNYFISSTKVTCTQDGANTATLIFDDRSCNGNVLSASVFPAGASSCRYGTYTSCSSTVAEVAQTAGLPAIANINYEKNDCKSGTGTYNTASYVALGCQNDQLWTANATYVSVKYFRGSNPLYSCNGQPSTLTLETPADYPIDVCINNGYGGTGSNQHTTEASTNPNKFKINIGTATPASTRPSLIGSSSSVKLSSYQSPSAYTSASSSSNLYACVANFAKVQASRMSMTFEAGTSSMGGQSIITVTIAPSTLATDVTPTAATSAIVAANGNLKPTSAYSFECSDIIGLYFTNADDGGGSLFPIPTVYYGATISFSMSFNFSGTAFLTDLSAQSQLAREMAVNAGVDETRLVYVSSSIDAGKTRVVFSITPSTYATDVTPDIAFATLATKSSSSSMSGTYASAASTEGPEVLLSIPGAASYLTVGAGTFIALAIAAIMSVFQL